jgi:formamidopyrimidine-DNA glycosylase
MWADTQLRAYDYSNCREPGSIQEQRLCPDFFPMPELPDIVVYIERLVPRVLNQTINGIRLLSPFFLRSVVPSIEEIRGKRVLAIRRIGKRIVLCLEEDLFLVLHLMIAGRLHWRVTGRTKPGKNGLAILSFASGDLLVTEAGSKRRVSLRLVRGEEALQDLNPGGLEPLEADVSAFAGALRRENHTLKRALTDPHLFSGIGNAYSDEILHRARLSPFALTSRLEEDEISRLYEATRALLTEWVETLRAEAGEGFPEKVTAFRAGMAVHGRYQQPCPNCGTPVQRIVYAENEANYCAPCQTGGRLLADRALSRLLKSDWPRTIEELEARKGGGSLT